MAAGPGPVFHLGSHRPGWLWRVKVPLFVSDRQLRRYRRLRPATTETWALDSGAFSELQLHGGWAHGPTPAEYVARARRYSRQIGRLAWIAQQDWPCEPIVRFGGVGQGGLRFAGTGASVLEHQQRTVANLLELRCLASELPIAPVLQGWTPTDYRRAVAMFHDAGIDLAAEPIVGVGSVCRRQGSAQAADIIAAVCQAVPGIRLHGFGVKIAGLLRFGHLLTSADSMSWSYAARYAPPLPQCTHNHCTNCLRYALQWRDSILATALPSQP